MTAKELYNSKFIPVMSFSPHPNRPHGGPTTRLAHRGLERRPRPFQASYVHSGLNTSRLVLFGGVYNQGSNGITKFSLYCLVTQTLHYDREFTPKFDVLQI